MSDLRISSGLALPVDVAGEAIAILAKRGAGKTNTGRVLVEELHQADVQTVVLDPVGAWWGLRGAADGKGAGLPIPILGGAHGDVPLEATAGRLLADVVVDTGQSLVLDLSDFSKTQQRQFVVDFAERLYTRKARQPSLLHVVLEEADEFAPQRVSAGDARMVGAIEQLVRRGRGRGIGLTMITQRSAALNKGVLEQTDVLLVMRTTGPRDRAAIAAWVDKQDVDGAEDVLPSLATLQTGEAWVWNPERGVLDRVRIRLATTFDSGATPKAGRAARKLDLAPIDLSALGDQIAETAERAKENDPGALRRRIKRLETDLAKRPTETQTVEVEKVVEVPALRDADVVELGRQIDRLFALRDEILNALHDAAGAAAVLLEQAQKAPGATSPVPARAPSRPALPAARPTAPARTRPEPPSRRLAAVDVAISTSQQRILDALGWFEWVGVASPSRAALAPMAKSKPTSGGFKNNLGSLRSSGLLDYPQPNRVSLTDDGRASAAAPEGAPTDEALQDAVLSAVTGSQAAILRALIAAFPNPLSREELSEQVGAPVTSGGFKNNLGALRTLELLDYPEPGYVVALPVLFPVSEGSQ